MKIIEDLNGNVKKVGKFAKNNVIPVTLAAAIGVSPVVGCKKNLEPEQEPPCTSVDCSDDYKNIIERMRRNVATQRSSMYPGDLEAFEEYVKVIFQSDPETFKKLAQISSVEDVYKKFVLMGQKIPLWQSNPMYKNNNQNNPNFHPYALDNFHKSFCEEHADIIATFKPGFPQNGSEEKMRQLEIGDKYKEGYIKEFYNMPNSVYMPYNAKYMEDTRTGAAKIYIAWGNPNFTSDISVKLSPNSSSGALVHELSGHVVTGDSEQNAHLVGEIIGDDMDLSRPNVNASYSWSANKTFLLNLIKNGASPYEVMEASQTSNSDINNLANKYLVVDGVQVCTWNDIMTASAIFDQLRYSPLKKVELRAVAGNIDGLNFTERFPDSLGESAMDVLNHIIDPTVHNGTGSNSYEAPTPTGWNNTREQNIEIIQNFFKVMNKFARENNIEPAQLIDDKLIPGSRIINYEENAQQIEELWQKAKQMGSLKSLETSSLVMPGTDRTIFKTTQAEMAMA